VLCGRTFAGTGYGYQRESRRELSRRRTWLPAPGLVIGDTYRAKIERHFRPQRIVWREATQCNPEIVFRGVEVSSFRPRVALEVPH
jgi:hypothetical protein